MGRLCQRQLVILYILFWAWERVKVNVQKKSTLSSGDAVMFKKTKEQHFSAHVEEVSPGGETGFYAISYTNEENKKSW